MALTNNPKIPNPKMAAARSFVRSLNILLKFVRLFFGGIETFLQIEPSALQAFLKLVED